jgi:hypothetical protein
MLVEELITSVTASARVLVEELTTAEVTRISTPMARNVCQVFQDILNMLSPFTEKLILKLHGDWACQLLQCAAQLP